MNDMEHITIEPSVVVSELPSHKALIDGIFRQLDNACANEAMLEQSWVAIGRSLHQAKQVEAWRSVGFNSYPDFMLHLRERFRRGKSQLWAYMSVVEHLLPTIAAEQLDAMGISKAQELKRAQKKNGNKPIPEDIVALACESSTTAKEVRARLAQAFNLAPDDKGSWFDLDGFFMTPEERVEFNQAVRVTMHLLGLKKEIPEHIKRKEIFFAWAREFKGTHEHEVYAQPALNTPAVLMLPVKANETE